MRASPAELFGPLQGRAFRQLFESQAASMTADGLVPVALSFAVISLEGGAGEIGLVLGAQWLAMVAFALAGGAAALAWKPERPLLTGGLLLAFVAPSLAFLAFGAPLPALAAAAFLGGAGNGLFMALWDTALQQHVPGEALGRVSAIDWGASTALLPLGYVLVGPAAALLGERALLALASVVVVALAAATVARRDVRDLRQPADPPPHGPSETAERREARV